MTDITNVNDDIEKFLQGKMKASGLSLEDEVTKILKTKGYGVRRNSPYYDPDEDKARAIEILSSKSFPDDNKLQKGVLHSIAQFALIIECKNISGNIWVFSEEKAPDLSFPTYASMNYGERDPAINVMPTEPIQGIPYASGYDEFIFDKNKSNGKETNLYSAIQTVTKATNYNQESYNKLMKQLRNWKPSKQNYILHFVYLQSVIIFNGKMYLKHEKDGKQNFTFTEFVQMGKSYLTKDHLESMGEIHIVSSNSLEKYLQMVEKYYRSNEDVIIKNQNEFLKALNIQ